MPYPPAFLTLAKFSQDAVNYLSDLRQTLLTPERQLSFDDHIARFRGAVKAIKHFSQILLYMVTEELSENVWLRAFLICLVST